MKKFFIVFSYSLYIFFVLGFFFHTSAHPQLFGKYTIPYFLLLLSLLIGLPLLILLLRSLSKKTIIKVRKRKIILTTWRKILLTIIVIFVFIILPIESFLRLKYSKYESNTYTYTADNFDPFLQFKITNSYSSHIDSYGFRGSEIKMKKPEKTYRIFLLGGSTVLNKVTDYEKTSARVLEKKLQIEYPTKKIEVLNAGVDGYTSEHSLMQYLFKIKDFDPDLIIMWHGINDWYYSCSPPERTYSDFQSDYSHFWGADAAMAHEHFRPQPLVSFKLISYDFFIKFMKENWFSELFLKIKITNPSDGDYNERTISKQYNMTSLPSLQPYKRNVISLVNATKADNVMLILGNQPYLYKKNMKVTESRHLYIPALHCTKDGKYPSIDSVMKGMQEFNMSTEKIAKDNEITYIDLNAALPKNLKYFTDDVHYSDKGNEKIAEVLYKTIVSKDLIEPF